MNGRRFTRREMIWGVLKDAYLQAGLPIAGDATGFTTVQGIPNTIGRSATAQLYGKRRVWSRMSRLPYPTISTLRSNAIAWPMVAPDMRSPYRGEQIGILGGRPAFGRDDALRRSDCFGAIRSFYPQSVARHGLWEAVRHYEHGLVQHHDMERLLNAERERTNVPQ